MMSESHPKTHSQARKRSLSKGQHGGIAANAPMEKEPSLPLERPDAASSSSALAAPSGVSVAAKRASEERTEGPAVEELIFGTVTGEDPYQVPQWTGNSNEASTFTPEALEAALSISEFMVGENFCPVQVGICKSRNEQAKILSLKRLPVIEDDIGDEQPGSDSKDCKKCASEQEEKEIYANTVEIRQALPGFEKTPEGKAMNDGLKEEVLKLLAAVIEKIEKIDMIILDKTSCPKILRTMFFQRANMTLKSSFSSSEWRKENRFPRFDDNGAEYLWWKQNFDPEILEKRLKIFREAAKNLNSKFDVFEVIEGFSILNASLHRQPSKNEPHEKDEDKISRLHAKNCSLRSGGDSKS